MILVSYILIWDVTDKAELYKDSPRDTWPTKLPTNETQKKDQAIQAKG